MVYPLAKVHASPPPLLVKASSLCYQPAPLYQQIQQDHILLPTNNQLCIRLLWYQVRPAGTGDGTYMSAMLLICTLNYV